MHVFRLHAHRPGPSLLSLAVSLASTSCTLVIDRSAEQCEDNGDCAQFPGTICSRDKVCISSTGPSCTTNQECLEVFGQDSICTRTERRCAYLKSSECSIVEGETQNDAAVILGAVLPIQGEDASTGQAMSNAISMAMSDFNQFGGLPPLARGVRPLAAVICDDQGENTRAEAAGEHLASLGIPAVIGAATSGRTTDMFNRISVVHPMLVMSPAATSTALTDLTTDTQGLLWRTAPSDSYQMKALALYFARVESEVRTALQMSATDKVRLAILNKGDLYGSFLGRELKEELTLNGISATSPENSESFVQRDYGDPGRPEMTRYPAALQAVSELMPHVIMIFGTGEVVTELLVPIERDWQATGFRPRYVFSDGLVTERLWESVGRDDELRQRIRGTVPGSNSELFRQFVSDYKSRYPDGSDPEVWGAAGSYDATYLLAYGAVAAATEALDGPVMADGLKALADTQAQAIDVGPGDINAAVEALRNGMKIDFTGASGPLDFDLATGEAPSDIQVWCLPSVNGAAGSARNSGLFYSAATHTLQGSISGTICE